MLVADRSDLARLEPPRQAFRPAGAPVYAVSVAGYEIVLVAAAVLAAVGLGWSLRRPTAVPVRVRIRDRRR